MIGFIKLAIKQQAHLVPVLVLGEVCCLQNFIDIPALHQWTYTVMFEVARFQTQF